MLYASWENRDSTLVSRAEFEEDLVDNYREMKKFGIKKSDAQYYLLPYEWYNDIIAAWSEDLGIRLINFTAGTSSNQDWTYPELGESYVSSEQIMQNILQKADATPSGLNGYNLLIHFGTEPRREDKLYHQLDTLISTLKSKGYQFNRIDKSAHE